MSIRTQLVARLKTHVPLLDGNIFGVVDFEAALQTSLKVNSAFVYTDGEQSQPMSDASVAEQWQISKYSIVIMTKNVKDSGDLDTADQNDLIRLQIKQALIGWLVDDEPFYHVSGKAKLLRNMLMWEDIYAHRSLFREEYQH